MQSEQFNQAMIELLEGLTAPQVIVRLMLVVHLLLDAGGYLTRDEFDRYRADVKKTGDEK